MLADASQTRFGPIAEQLAADTRFYRRMRAITGPVFARTVAAEWGSLLEDGPARQARREVTRGFIT